MDPREQFSTEAFLRYGAECRRMAKLARPPGPRTIERAAAGSRPGALHPLALILAELGLSERRLKSAAPVGYR